LGSSNAEQRSIVIHLSPNTASAPWLYRDGEMGYQRARGVTLLPHLVPTQPNWGTTVPAQALAVR